MKRPLDRSFSPSPLLASVRGRRRRARRAKLAAGKPEKSRGCRIYDCRAGRRRCRGSGRRYLGSPGRSLMSIRDGVSYLAADRKRAESNGRPGAAGGISISRIPVSNRACSTPTPTRRETVARLPAGYLCALADSTFRPPRRI